MTRWSGHLTLGFAGVAHSFAHLFVLLYATVVLALEREWGLPYAELFALSIPGTVMFGIAAIPAGWLGDRWSGTGMMAISFFGGGATAVLTGFAQTPLAIGIGLTVLGTFAAIYHPVGIPWLVKHAVNRGRALGINGVFGSAGTAAAALVAGALTDLFGWRAAFIVPGLVSIGIGTAFVIAVRRGLIRETTEDAAPEPTPAKADMRRAFGALAVTVLCTGLIYQATAFALPKIFAERLGSFLGGGVVGIGGVVTFSYVVGAMAQIIGGELSDRYRLKSIYVTSQVLQLPVLLVAFTLHNPALIGAAAMMVGLNVAGQPAENALLARYAPPAWRGRVFGAKFVLTFGVSTAGVALIPIIHAMTGRLDVLFLALFAFAAIAGLAASRLPAEPAPRSAAAD